MPLRVRATSGRRYLGVLIEPSWCAIEEGVDEAVALLLVGVWRRFDQLPGTSHRLGRDVALLLGNYSFVARSESPQADAQYSCHC